MEKIVGEAEGGGESVEDELTFPHLNYIKLFNLPKLESFCSQAYILKWPALEKVKVEECPKLKAMIGRYPNGQSCGELMNQTQSMFYASPWP
ncbi:hypothetical protein ACE6H2_006124 [Prunus campanulata]